MQMKRAVRAGLRMYCMLGDSAGPIAFVNGDVLPHKTRWRRLSLTLAVEHPRCWLYTCDREPLRGHSGLVTSTNEPASSELHGFTRTHCKNLSKITIASV